MDWILNKYKGRPAAVLAQVRRCGCDDLEKVYGLQQLVRASMPRPELYLPDTKEELSEMLCSSLCIGVWVQQELVAFFILRYCGQSAHNYAKVLAVPQSDWCYWANADSVAVHPDYRGNALQRRLMRLAEQWRDPAILGIGATVSPENPYSLNNLLQCGYEIALRCEMYGGHDRYLLQKRLLPLAGEYRHFKGLAYQVLQIARHSETQEPMVVYRALYGGHETWVRPASMWFEHVEREGYSGPRFCWSGAAAPKDSI